MRLKYLLRYPLLEGSSHFIISFTYYLVGFSIHISQAVIERIYSSSCLQIRPLSLKSIMLKAVQLILFSLSLSFNSYSHIILNFIKYQQLFGTKRKIILFFQDHLTFSLPSILNYITMKQIRKTNRIIFIKFIEKILEKDLILLNINTFYHEILDSKVREKVIIVQLVLPALLRQLIMIAGQKEHSLIARILQENFNRSPSAFSFNKFISRDPLQLLVLERKDKNVAYMTDGVLTILTLLSSKQQEMVFFPQNRLPTNHYTYEPKIFAHLNFTSITPPPSQNEKNPYSPHHYFKEQYEDFIQFRKTFKVSAPYEAICILEWNLALVNINSSGYYAPLISIRKHKKHWSNTFPDYLQLNSILYERWLQQQMEKYRLQDIRRLNQNKFPPTQSSSTFYFLRNLKKSNPMTKNSPLVITDVQMRLLKYQQQRAKNYVLLGNLKGTLSFINPFNNIINASKIYEMNASSIASLFNGLSLKQKKEKKGGDQAELWSDESKSDDDEAEPNSRENQDQQALDPYDSDDGEDPLKNIYTRLISNMKQEKKQQIQP